MHLVNAVMRSPFRTLGERTRVLPSHHSTDRVMFLTPADVARLTKRTRFAAQRRALDALGIPYTQATDGEPLVRAADLDSSRDPGRNSGPRWDRMRA